MPYRINPANRSEVQVFKDGAWQKYHTYSKDAKGRVKARDLLYALKKNVEDAAGGG